jgi:hypothetical protein
MAGTASAGVVTEWSYMNQAGFADYNGSNNPNYPVTATGDSSGAYDNILTTGPLPTDLHWGEPFDVEQSGLTIDSPIAGGAGSLITGGGFVQGTSITHENNILYSNSQTLVNALVLDGLTLTPTAWDYGNPGSNPNLAPQLGFGINFYETPNSANPCANGEANNQGDNINGCGDIFEITGLGNIPVTPVFGPGFVEFTVPFFLSTGDASWDDQVYYLTTRLSGLTVLPQGYNCQSGPACFGFVTKEDQDNVLNAQFKIRVPEPGTIGLFGLALIGTAFAGRRKRA